MSRPLYVHEASTAKLFGTPSHGSPNVFTDTPMLQLFDPMQACKRVIICEREGNILDHKQRGM